MKESKHTQRKKNKENGAENSGANLPLWLVGWRNWVSSPAHCSGKQWKKSSEKQIMWTFSKANQLRTAMLLWRKTHNYVENVGKSNMKCKHPFSLKVLAGTQSTQQNLLTEREISVIDMFPILQCINFCKAIIHNVPFSTRKNKPLFTTIYVCTEFPTDL